MVFAVERLLYGLVLHWGLRLEPPFGTLELSELGLRGRYFLDSFCPMPVAPTHGALKRRLVDILCMIGEDLLNHFLLLSFLPDEDALFLYSLSDLCFDSNILFLLSAAHFLLASLLFFHLFAEDVLVHLLLLHPISSCILTLKLRYLSVTASNRWSIVMLILANIFDLLPLGRQHLLL